MSYNISYRDKLLKLKSILATEKYTREDSDIEYAINNFQNIRFVSYIMDNYGPESSKMLFQIIDFKEYKKNSKIFKVGEQSTYCYIVLLGEVAVLSYVKDANEYSGHENIILSTLKVGDLFGDSTKVKQLR